MITLPTALTSSKEATFQRYRRSRLGPLRLERGAMTDVPYRELFVPRCSDDSRLVVAYMLNSASGGR